MGAAAPVHPNDQTLQSYGLGKLDDALTPSVKRHLESCIDCRRRVAEVSSGNVLDRLWGTERCADPSGPLGSADTWLSMLGADATQRHLRPPTPCLRDWRTTPTTRLSASLVKGVWGRSISPKTGSWADMKS